MQKTVRTNIGIMLSKSFHLQAKDFNSQRVDDELDCGYCLVFAIKKITVKRQSLFFYFISKLKRYFSIIKIINSKMITK